MFDQGISLPARAMNIEFLKSMTWDDLISIEVDVANLRTRAFTLSVLGRKDEGTTAFRGELAMVCISTESLKAVALPESLRLALRTTG